MDENSGDYIALNGDGVINSKYSNKGSFDMFGNYIVDHGIYKLTIQNVIKKDFQFLQGSTITFGGDPYLAPLNMKAQYTVNGVSLADLQIGNSFSSNNVRVDCMMNITGTPQAPHVDFDFDLPTVNSDAKQMVRSVINSEEELNQQVIYLLAVGRFYAGNRNNNAAEENAQQSQTSLAMSSLLSGTISQQINNVLSSWFNNNNWNFGANISIPTGGTPGTISLAIAVDGATLPATTMEATPAAVNEPFNVSEATHIPIWRGCCQTLTVRNTSDQPIQVANANIVFTRPDLAVTY